MKIIKPTDDLMQIYGIPVFAEIMDFELSDKGSYKYSSYYSSSRAEKQQTEQADKNSGSTNRKENA